MKHLKNITIVLAAWFTAAVVLTALAKATFHIIAFTWSSLP